MIIIWHKNVAKDSIKLLFVIVWYPKENICDQCSFVGVPCDFCVLVSQFEIDPLFIKLIKVIVMTEICKTNKQTEN